jgi:hypothetical protein
VRLHLVTIAQASVPSMAADLAARAMRSAARSSRSRPRVVVDAATVGGTRVAPAHGDGRDREYRLHPSRRLWAWRHGTAAKQWRRARRDVAAAGADELFPTISR